MQLIHLGKKHISRLACISAIREICTEFENEFDIECNIESKNISLTFKHKIFSNSAWLTLSESPNLNPLTAGLNCYDLLLAGNANCSYFEAIKCYFSKWLQYFSEDEISRIKKLNPIVAKVSDFYKHQGTNLSEAVIVIRDHFLIEKINIITSLLTLGLNPCNCWIIAKEDQSLNRSKVYWEYVNLGCNVYNEPKEKDFTKICQEIMTKSYSNILIMDDGGDFIVNFHSICDITKHKVSYIETTSKGIKLLESKSISNVINLATCALKDSLSHNIAVSCAIRFRDILRHHMLAGTFCHVVGYGKLGKSIASLLAALGVNITISDVCHIRREEAMLAGYKVYPSIKSALINVKHNYIFGCSGNQAVTLEDVLLMNESPVLATCSSQDLQPVINSLKKITSSEYFEGIGDFYKLDLPSKNITILACGHALNLYLAEGVPEPEYDPFTTLLLATLVETYTSCTLQKEPNIKDILEKANLIVLTAMESYSSLNGNSNSKCA